MFQVVLYMPVQLVSLCRPEFFFSSTSGSKLPLAFWDNDLIYEPVYLKGEFRTPLARCRVAGETRCTRRGSAASALHVDRKPDVNRLLFGR